MKMAAAEALYDTEQPAVVLDLHRSARSTAAEEVHSVKIPRLLSFLPPALRRPRSRASTTSRPSSRRSTVPGDYRPNIPLAYWSFRSMIGFGLLAALAALLGALADCGAGACRRAAGCGGSAIAAAARCRSLANSFGWIFTEMGRQPWVGVRRAEDRRRASRRASAPPRCSSRSIVFTPLYGVLAVVEVGLMVTYVKAGPPPVTEAAGDDADDDRRRPLAFAY